jgi:hypothetical protein
MVVSRASLKWKICIIVSLGLSKIRRNNIICAVHIKFSCYLLIGGSKVDIDWKCLLLLVQNKLITVSPDTKVLRAMELMTGMFC